MAFSYKILNLSESKVGWDVDVAFFTSSGNGYKATYSLDGSLSEINFHKKLCDIGQFYEDSEAAEVAAAAAKEVKEAIFNPKLMLDKLVDATEKDSVKFIDEK